MNPADLADDLVVRWVIFYTRRLPARVKYARLDELVSDLWEQRHDARVQGRSDLAVAVSTGRRMLAGMPADLSWRFAQLVSAQGRVAERLALREEAAATVSRVQDGWVRQHLRTRKCRACGQRYSRKLPYCPECKTRPGHDGIPKDPNWLAAP